MSEAQLCTSAYCSPRDGQHVSACPNRTPKIRPTVTVWEMRSVDNAPWERPMNDAELTKLNLNPADYEPETNGRWAW